MGFERQGEAALFDIGHPNGSSNRRSLEHRRIAKQSSIRHNRSETVHMDDVVELRIGGRLAH
jgi:hypothetical protein